MYVCAYMYKCERKNVDFTEKFTLIRDTDVLGLKCLQGK